MVFGSTLPSGPPSTAVTLTLAGPGRWSGRRARPRHRDRRVRPEADPPEPVLTMLPRGSCSAVGVEVPEADRAGRLRLSTRLPVAGKVSLTVTGIVSTSAGTTPARRVRLGRGRVGDDRQRDRADRLARGVTTIVADGRNRYAPTTPTSRARARTPPPMSHGVRTPPLRRQRVARRANGPRRRRRRPGGRRRRAWAAGCIRVHVDRRADRRRRAALPIGRGAVAAGRDVARAVPSDSGRAVAVAWPRPTRRPHRVPPASPGSWQASRPLRTAAAAAAPSSPRRWTVVVRSAEARRFVLLDAGEDRQAGRGGERPRRRSLATIDSRLSWVSASRARSRKLIRDVATREPYGRTTATRGRARTPRIRAAAEVISSSTSR